MPHPMTTMGRLCVYCTDGGCWYCRNRVSTAAFAEAAVMVDRIVDLMPSMTQVEREAVLLHLTVDWCRCGNRAGCQCENDD